MMEGNRVEQILLLRHAESPSFQTGPLGRTSARHSAVDVDDGLVVVVLVVALVVEEVACRWIDCDCSGAAREYRLVRRGEWWKREHRG
jgi:hypothetical protein